MSSIRRQLVALLLGVGLPLLALEAWNAGEHYRHQVERAQLDVLRIANRAAAATAELVELSTRSMASLADTLTAVGAFDRESCEAIVLPAARAVPFFANVGLLDVGGMFVCATTPLPSGPGSSALDRAWFRELLVDGEPVVTAPLQGRVTKAWVINVAHPVRNGTGDVVGVVAGSMDLAAFQGLLAGVPIPEAALLTIVDGDGAVLARSRDFESWVGRPLVAGDEVREEAAGEGAAVTRTRAAEGEPMTFGRVDVPSVGWRVFAGLPDALVYGPARRAAAENLLITVPLLLLALGLGGELFRRTAGSLRTLEMGVENAGAGNPIPEEGPDEVRAVARALNRTLEARDRAEAAERQAKDRFRSILENAVFGVYLSSPDGRILEVNPALAHLLGYPSPAALKEAGMSALYPDAAVRECLVAEHLASGEPIRGRELEWRRRDGTAITVRLSGQLVEGSDQEPLFEVIVEDITDQRALEAEYRHTQKMEAVGRLAGGVAHDFNNVLTAILGHAMLMVRTLPKDGEARADAAEIVVAAQRASALTRQLLAFSRKEVIQPRLVDVSELVFDLQRMVGRLIGEDVEVVTHLGEDLPPVKIDPSQMEQIVLNLLVNARDALPDGGRIEVRTARELPGPGDGAEAPRGWVSLEITDDGAGMEADVQERIFEPFFTTKPAGEGTGLGLSTVYGIVTGNGGSIHVQSEPGKGTSFLVLLPAATSRAEEGRDGGAPGRRARGEGTILMAEDEPAVRDVVRRVLERAGYHVIAACDGAEALTVAAELDGPLSLFLTDVVMPGLSGLETADRLVADRPGTPVLFMSGYTESEGLRSRTVADPNVFLAKPFTPDELLERVQDRIATAGNGSRGR